MSIGDTQSICIPNPMDVAWLLTVVELSAEIQVNNVKP